MHEQPITLATGANKGIGLQIAKDLLAHGLTVLVGSRDRTRGKAAAATPGAGAHTVQLDVIDADSIGDRSKAHPRHVRPSRHAGEQRGHLAHRPAWYAADGHHRRWSRMVCMATLAEVRQLFATNVFGVIAVTQTMLPLLRAAPLARIVNISSGTASLAYNADTSNPRRATFGIYSATKTALNAITAGRRTRARGIMVNAVASG